MTMNVYDAYLKARKAYEDIPKQSFTRTFNEKEQTITLTCPTCGIVFAQYEAEMNFCFNEPIFCCGKLLI